MYKHTVLCIIILLLTAVIAVPVAADIPILQSNKDSLTKYRTDAQADKSSCTSNSFNIVYTGTPSSTVDLYINNDDVSGIIPPEFDSQEMGTSSMISPGHYKVTTASSGMAYISFKTSSQTAAQTYTFKVVDPSGVIPTSQISIDVLAAAPAPTPTMTPTPEPTTTTGSVTVKSMPSGATIFLDNAVKGITPLTIEGISNGNHVIMLRFDNYQDMTSGIVVGVDTQIVDLTLIKIIPTTTPTTVVTTIMATNVATPETTTALQNAGISTTTATPVPTKTVNYSATIAALEHNISDQNKKIEEQNDLINQILSFLGLK